MSVRSVASVRNRNAPFCSCANVAASALALATLTCQSDADAGYGLKVPKLRENGSRGFRAPTCQSRIAVSGIANQRKVIRDRFWRHTEFSDHARLVKGDPCPPIELNHALAADALGQILIGSADDYAIDTRIGVRQRCCRRERIVGLKLHHRPNGNPRRRESLFQQRELREQIRIDAVARLVSGPQIIPERFDDVIRGDGQMRLRRP